MDQLQSAQPGLVTQLSGKLTISHIWSAQEIMNHLSDLTYVHLMRITIHEGKLAVNQPLKDDMTHLDLKLK